MKLHQVLAPLVAGMLAITIVFGLGCGKADPACSCTGEVKPACKEECDDGDTGTSSDPLSTGATAVYTITNGGGTAATGTNCNAGIGPWSGGSCSCGIDYTDNASRCNTSGEVLFVHFTKPSCTIASASLTYQASLWNGAATVDVRGILRPVTAPTMGVAGLCTSSTMASWYRSGPEAWTTPGAAGNTTDRTSSGTTFVLASGGVRTVSIDVTALVVGCTGPECVLAQFNPSTTHVNVLGGTAAILYECAGPSAVCGDSTTEGSEACDDGNTTAGDGCSPACALEPGWSCTTASPSSCETTCGDGTKAGAEQCDDGNLVSADGCSSSCTAETCTWQ